MYNKLLIVFLILLVGLILFQFLGNSKYFNEGFSNMKNFVSPDGSKAVVSDSVAVVTTPNGTKTTYNKSDSKTGPYGVSTMYTASNGNTALMTTGNTGTSVFYTKNADGSGQVSFTQDTNTSTNTSTTTNVDSSSQQQQSTSFSGTDYDNYNHYNQSSLPSIFYGPNGATAKVIETPNNNTIVITNKNGTTEIYYIDTNQSPDISSVKKYYGPNGGNATIIEVNGKKAVQIIGPNGNKIIYYSDNVYSYSNNDNTINQYDSNSVSNGSDYASAFSSIYSAASNMIQGPSGNTAATYDSSAYYNSLPQGIPKSMIPSGQEDLYILKSEVVPPVCPAPTVIKVPYGDDFDVSKCPPCEPCARCPEPSFECKKVPTYSAFNPSTMPMPVLNDFSTFGM
jgi:hypothetical protein